MTIRKSPCFLYPDFSNNRVKAKSNPESSSKEFLRFQAKKREGQCHNRSYRCNGKAHGIGTQQPLPPGSGLCMTTGG